MAKDLAREIGYIYIDSGAMYRAVTLYSLQKGFFSEKGIDTEALKTAMPDIHISFRLNPETQRPMTFLNDTNVEDAIRSMEVSSHVLSLIHILVTISLKDVYHKVNASLTHEIVPNDILIHQRGTNHITPHRYLLQSGNTADCIDVAIMAEGYTEKEMDIFYKDAQTACDALFSHEPFKKLKEKFNIVAVASPSEDSGVSIPGQGKWKSTAVSSHFNTFYSDPVSYTHLERSGTI